MLKKIAALVPEPLNYVIIAFIILGASLALAMKPHTMVKSSAKASDPWYEPAQAARGKALYAQQCAVCHGANLEGGAGPSLAGTQFFLRHNGEPLQGVWSAIHDRMPKTAPGTLSADQAFDLTAFILQENHLPAGTSPLAAADLQRTITGTSGVADSANATIVRQPSTTLVSQNELNAPNAGDWLAHGGDYGGSNYSQLADVTSANVSRLKLHCSVSLSAPGSLQAMPLAYRGNLYVTTTFSTFAINGATCAKLWTYNYVSTDLDAGFNNKGVAIADGRVIRGTSDGHLIALDAKTGTLLWNRKIADTKGASAIASPLIWNDLVFMGIAGGDVPGVHGKLEAYRVKDGTKAWSFATMKDDREGGGIWTFLTLDKTTGTLYAPVGNPEPDFNVAARPGPGLYSTGIVALDARKGALRWAYQMNPRDAHDWDATGASAVSAGAKHMVVATSKDGFVHILDASNGALERKVPVTTILNATAPITPSGTHFCPGIMGGTEWSGSTWSPKSQLLYINSVDWCATVNLDAHSDPHKMSVSSFGGGAVHDEPMSKAFGWTTALDPLTGTVRWHKKMPTPMLANILATAGGVLFTGDLNGRFVALDATSGRYLYQYDTRGAMGGGIMTYLAGGKQYIAAATGNTSLVAWKVTGKPTLLIFTL